MNKWEFLQPWLDVLSARVAILPEHGWQPNRNGAASLALRLDRIIVNANTNTPSVEEPPQLQSLARAIEIVAMALRANPHVWRMLNGASSSDVYPYYTASSMPAVCGHDCFRDENVAVASWEISVSLRYPCYRTEAAVNSFKQILCDADTDTERTDAKVSTAAYRDARARIKRLNVFRAVLSDPVPVTITLSVNSESASRVNDVIAAITPRSRARFIITGLQFWLYDCGPWVSDMFRGLPRQDNVSIELVAVPFSGEPRLGVSDVLDGLEATPPPQHLSVWLGFGPEVPAVATRVSELRIPRLRLAITCFFEETMEQIWQAIDQAQAASTGNTTPTSTGVLNDNSFGAGVERLELMFGYPLNVTAELNDLGEIIDPLAVAAQLWGRRHTCSLKQHALQQLQETGSVPELETTTTVYDCIPGNDASVAFLVIPSTKELLCVPTVDVQITTTTLSRLPPPRWLTSVRSLQLDHSGYWRFAALPPLLYLLPSLVSLALTSWPLDLGDIVPSVLLSLPSSLEYLDLEGCADQPSHLQALFQAYEENALRVRSLKIGFSESHSLLTLLTATSDPTSSIATRLEELVVKFECREMAKNTESERVGCAIERTLELSERLNYFHIFGIFPHKIRDQWRVKVAPFHRTIVPNRIGYRLPRVCTLALASVVRHYEYALDSGVLANIVAFANGGLVRIAVVSSPDGV